MTPITETSKAPTFLESMQSEISDKNSRLATLTARLENLCSKFSPELVDKKDPASDLKADGMAQAIEGLVKQYDKHLDRLCAAIEKIEKIV